MSRIICDLFEDVKYIEEAKDNGKKSLYVTGIALQSEITNRNGRRYPKEILEKEVHRYTTQYIDKNRAYGELGHPSSGSINLDRVSHLIKELKQDGNNFIIKAKIAEETPMGKIAAGLIREGAQLGISSRGLGSLKEVSGGIMEVQSDFILATAGDLVSDPSAPDAWLSAIYESKEWVYDAASGEWVGQTIDNIKKTMNSTPKKQLQEQKLHLFEKFLSRLKVVR